MEATRLFWLMSRSAPKAAVARTLLDFAFVPGGDMLPAGRWVVVNPIGYAEDGLLVLTSDGGLASRAGRAGRLLPVEYRVRALRPERLTEWPEVPLSVVVEGHEANFTSVEPAAAGGTNQWFKVTAGRAVPRASRPGRPRQSS